MSFGQENLAKILSVEFEEVEAYEGAEFEFFASNSTDCSPEKVLIKGNRDMINGIVFENGQLFSCYGLKITKVVDHKRYGNIAAIKNFQFFVEKGERVLSSFDVRHNSRCNLRCH